jgi:hypothetical protein
METQIREWAKKTYRKTKSDGVTGAAWGLYHLYLGGWISLTSRHPVGTNVFDREWDVLIVLDACRVDALREVAGEYDFIRDVDSITSVGSTSSEWVSKTFTEDYEDTVAETSYVSGNVYAELLLQKEQLPPETGNGSISFPVPVYDADWDTVSEDQMQSVEISTETGEHGEIKPRPMTERAVRTQQKADPERLIVHYMQPHRPYLGQNTPEQVRRNVTGALINGELTKTEVWSAYLHTLRHVLDEVKLALGNLEYDTAVLTADHGEGFGEHGSYGHDFGWPHPVKNGFRGPKLQQ